MTTATTKAPKQVAINDIGSADDFLAAVEKTLKFFNDGDLIEGTVVKIDRDEVLLDVGYKTEGVIPSRELSIKHDVDPSEVVGVGDTVEALVLQKEDKEGRLILSKKRAQYERAWGDVEKIKEADGVVTGSVIEVVKGGLIVDIGLRGFLPASLIELRRVRDLTPYLGQEIEAKILELDKNRNNVVLSRRALLEQTQSESRSTFLANLHPGQIRKGVISSIVNFGAFVDLGGVDGLVHVSELSWKHIEHASEVVEVGQEVTVEVLSVELDRERVSLSLKATQEDPWQVFARTHAIGQVAPGKVTKLVPFGAFVRVADGIEGLVHISELSGKHVELAEQVVSVGEEVFVKVIDIDLERRRISLSLKQANEGVDPEGTEFDPALYGMLTEYDEQGNYKYPEGFDPETNEWREGFEAQREKWEQDYAAAQARWEAHKKQVAAANAAAVPPTTRSLRRARRTRATPPARAPSPTTRRSRRCARSSRATTSRDPRTEGRSRRGPAFRRSGHPLSGGAIASAVDGCPVLQARVATRRRVERTIRVVLVYLIGLTGGIASGKSTVARRLVEHGAVHLDADQLARRVVEPGTPALAAIVEQFGAEFLRADGIARSREARQASSSATTRRGRGSTPSCTPPSASSRRRLIAKAEAEDPTRSSSMTCRCSSRHPSTTRSTSSS